VPPEGGSDYIFFFLVAFFFVAFFLAISSSKVRAVYQLCVSGREESTTFAHLHRKTRAMIAPPVSRVARLQHFARCAVNDGAMCGNVRRKMTKRNESVRFRLGL